MIAAGRNALPTIFDLQSRPLDALRGLMGRTPREAVRGDGPDFFCVGLQKAGTQWLYDQLQLHPDFWMPPFKELHYFDRTFPTGRIAHATQRFLTDPERYARTRRRRGLKPLDARDKAFFRKVAALADKPKDLDAYADLFADKADQISGDITPGYSSLANPVIRQLARRFPSAKVVLLLRDPVERAWSAWRMALAGNDDAAEREQDLAAVTAFLDRPGVIHRSYPTRIAAKWSKRFDGRFRFFFLDDIAAEPEATRAEILGFLGAAAAKPSGVRPDFNRKAKPKPPFRSEPIQALMRERFAEERERCARMFGGAATEWPNASY